MNDSDKKHEVCDFVNQFFNKVIDRLKEAGLDDRQYLPPQILFTTKRNLDEDEEFDSLYNRICDEIHQIPREKAEAQPESVLKGWIAEKLGFDCFARLDSLDAKLAHNSIGSSQHNKSRILLDETVIESQPNYPIISHELLHCIRDTAVGKSESHRGYNTIQRLIVAVDALKGVGRTKFVSPETAELFGILEEIVLPDIFAKDNRFGTFEKIEDIVFTMKNMRDYHHYFQGNPKAKFQEVLNLYNNILDMLYGYVQNVNEPLESLEASLQQFYRDKDRLLKATPYLLIIPRWEPNSLKFLQTDLQFLADTFSTQEKDIHRKRIISEAKTRFRAKTYSLCLRMIDEANILNSMVDSTFPYYVCRLAINEHKRELQDKWAKVFLMSSEMVQRKYISPIAEEIVEMQNPSVWQSLKMKFSKAARYF
ncbi:MAG: hypothetical protein ABIF10_07795 [Candidatus Woesearchaeota archaeon]